MTNAEIFIDKFNILEELLKDKFNIQNYRESALSEIERYPQFRHMKIELKYIREIRNVLVHEKKIGGEFPIQPNNELIGIIQNTIDYIKNPPKAFDKCVKINDVCCADFSNKIYPFMLEMKNKVYTHIPILENGVVKGVFSENTLFGALLEDELVYEKEKTTFSDALIKKYCMLENHVTETFKFVKKEEYLEDVKELFLDSFQGNQRLSMIFVTQNGRTNEKLLGIITPWDVLGK